MTLRIYYTTVRIKPRTCSLSRWKLIEYIVLWIFGLNFVLLQMGIKWLWFTVMRTKKTIFSQIMSQVSRYDFQKCVDRYKGDWHAKTLTCIDQFKIMSFAQFTGRSSLRDIEIQQSLGIRRKSFNQPQAYSTNPFNFF